MLAQDNKEEKLPYYEILPSPDNFGPGNVLARMVDGLGYRYHWATADLREEDLAYRPTPEASNAMETIEHIYSLSIAILNAAKNLPNTRPLDTEGMAYAEFRKATLENLQMASEAYRGMTAEALEKCMVSFKRGDTQSDFPIWHIMNGQLADALYHTGQLVSFRRTSGNPMNGSVSVFMGKNRE